MSCPKSVDLNQQKLEQLLPVLNLASDLPLLAS